MEFKQKIEEEVKRALKNQEPVLLSTLRMLLSAIRNREIEKRSKLVKGGGETADLEKSSKLTDEETTEVIRSEVKKRREAVTEYEKAGRKDLADKESQELTILQKYLPKELKDGEIEKIVQEVMAGLGQINPKDFGRVMGEVMKKLKGQASGDRISRILKDKIAAN